MIKICLIFCLLYPAVLFGQAFEPDSVRLENLEIRDYIYYTTTSNVPYTGFKLRSAHSLVTNETSEGQLLAGKTHGEWNFWRASGQKILQLTFENGIRNGSWAYYDENEQKMIEGHYQQGWLAGEYTLRNKEGKKEIVLLFEPEYWLQKDFNVMDHFGGTEHVFQFTTEEDGVVSALMAAGPSALLYSLDNERAERQHTRAWIFKLAVILLVGTLLFIKPKNNRIYYIFSLRKKSHRMVYLEIILWVLVCGTGGIIVLIVFGVATSVPADLTAILLLVRYTPFIVIGSILGVIAYFILLTLVLKKGFRVLAAYKKSES